MATELKKSVDIRNKQRGDSIDDSWTHDPKMRGAFNKIRKAEVGVEK